MSEIFIREEHSKRPICQGMETGQIKGTCADLGNDDFVCPFCDKMLEKNLVIGDTCWNCKCYIVGFST